MLGNLVFQGFSPKIMSYQSMYEKHHFFFQNACPWDTQKYKTRQIK